MRRRMLALLVVASLLFAGACREDIQVDPWYVGIGAKDSYEPNEVVLSIDVSGGFVPAEVSATRLPFVVVYGDGRVIARYPTDEIPEPALPDLRVRTVDEEALGSLVHLALQAGVGLDVEGSPLVADFPDTDFAVLTDQGPMSTSVYALGAEDGLTAEQIEARRRLLGLIEKLRDLPATLGAARAGQEQPYEPQLVAVVSRPWGDVLPTEPERLWPGPALPGEPLPQYPIVGEDDLSCVTATGAEASAALTAAAGATRETSWGWDGQQYAVWLRPLLPTESSCDDL